MKGLSEGKFWFKVSFSLEEQPKLTHYMPVASDSAAEACAKVEAVYDGFTLFFVKIEKLDHPKD